MDFKVLLGWELLEWPQLYLNKQTLPPK